MCYWCFHLLYLPAKCFLRYLRDIHHLPGIYLNWQ
ncbi:MAG: hypothetical protein E7Z77_02985 [Methanobrevibacter sp.]|nr:hypothetical protein [Methanobrevibacter sp.]